MEENQLVWDARDFFVRVPRSAPEWTATSPVVSISSIDSATDENSISILRGFAELGGLPRKTIHYLCWDHERLTSFMEWNLGLKMDFPADAFVTGRDQPKVMHTISLTWTKTEAKVFLEVFLPNPRPYFCRKWGYLAKLSLSSFVTLIIITKLVGHEVAFRGRHLFWRI